MHLKPLCSKLTAAFYISGQEKKKDVDDVENNKEGNRTPLTRHGSFNSLASSTTQSSSVTNPNGAVITVGSDNPEQFQSLKHQKDIWEQGIEM